MAIFPLLGASRTRADGLTAAGNSLWVQGTRDLDGSPERFDRFGWALTSGDFNGDRFADFAVGLPREDVGAMKDAGAVQIIYGRAPTPGTIGTPSTSRRTIWDQDVGGIAGSAEAGDQFGFAVAAGDFDGDGYDDLAVGVPFEDVGGSQVEDAGAVQVLYGSDGGIAASGNAIWSQDGVLKGGAEVADQLGFSLAAGDFDHDGFADLAIGIPREDVESNSIVDAGAVQIIYGSRGGLGTGSRGTGGGGGRPPRPRDQLFAQGSDSLRGKAETYDLFGWSLVSGDFDRDGFADLVVGIPYENIGSGARDAGAVQVLYGGRSGLETTRRLSGARRLQIFAQDNSSIVGQPQTGDWFGYALASGDFDRDGFADLAVGIPLEDVTGNQDGGAVQIFYGSSGGLSTERDRIFSQDSPDVVGVVEGHDEFGRALAAGDFDRDGFADLAIAIPLEDIGATEDAGAVQILYGSRGGLSSAGNSSWHQDTNGLLGSVAEKDRFGFALAAGDFNRDGVVDLAVGIPRERVKNLAEAGAVQILFGTR